MSYTIVPPNDDDAPRSEDASEAVANIIWRDLADEHGEVSPNAISDGYLDRLRLRIQAGEIPAFIETDFEAAWRLYARAQITNLFIRHRKRVGGIRIRRFFPVLSEAARGGIWAAAEDRPEDMLVYSHERLRSSVRSAVLLHGSSLVAFGDKTWDEVYAEAEEAARRAVEDAKKREDMEQAS